MYFLGREIPLPGSEPTTWQTLLDDCIASVSEVRNELHSKGVTDKLTLDSCEKICIAALLARLWQDVRVDVMECQNLYVPADIAAQHGLDLTMLHKALSLDTERGCEGDALDGSCHCANIPNTAMRIVLPAFCQTIHELVKRTDAIRREGKTIIGALPVAVRKDLRTLHNETSAILRMIKRHGYDTLSRRPRLGAMSRICLAVRNRLC